MLTRSKTVLHVLPCHLFVNTSVFWKLYLQRIWTYVHNQLFTVFNKCPINEFETLLYMKYTLHTAFFQSCIFVAVDYLYSHTWHGELLDVKFKLTPTQTQRVYLKASNSPGGLCGCLESMSIGIINCRFEKNVKIRITSITEWGSRGTKASGRSFILGLLKL